MALSQDLLDQARQLAEEGTGRPRQVSLRRAVSAAYYSLFHLLLDDVERRFAPGIRRTVTHAQMLTACEATVSEYDRQTHNPTGGKAKIPIPLRGIVLSADIRVVASAFIDLQQARHEADYDTRATLGRTVVRSHLRQCDQAHEAWAKIRNEAQARALLTMMVLDLSKLKDR